MEDKINPLYEAYSKYHGNTPGEQLKLDEIRYPGGLMCGYILWIDELRQEFYKFRPDCFLGRHTICGLDEWYKFVVDYGNR